MDEILLVLPGISSAQQQEHQDFQSTQNRSSSRTVPNDGDIVKDQNTNNHSKSKEIKIQINLINDDCCDSSDGKQSQTTNNEDHLKKIASPRPSKYLDSNLQNQQQEKLNLSIQKSLETRNQHQQQTLINQPRSFLPKPMNFLIPSSNQPSKNNLLSPKKPNLISPIITSKKKSIIVSSRKGSPLQNMQSKGNLEQLKSSRRDIEIMEQTTKSIKLIRKQLRTGVQEGDMFDENMVLPQRPANGQEKKFSKGNNNRIKGQFGESFIFNGANTEGSNLFQNLLQGIFSRKTTGQVSYHANHQDLLQYTQYVQQEMKKLKVQLGVATASDKKTMELIQKMAETDVLNENIEKELDDRNKIVYFNTQKLTFSSSHPYFKHFLAMSHQSSGFNESEERIDKWNFNKASENFKSSIVSPLNRNSQFFLNSDSVDSQMNADQSSLNNKTNNTNTNNLLNTSTRSINQSSVILNKTKTLKQQQTTSIASSPLSLKNNNNNGQISSKVHITSKRDITGTSKKLTKKQQLFNHPDVYSLVDKTHTMELTRLEESLKELAQKKDDHHGGQNSNSSMYSMATVAQAKTLLQLAEEFYERQYGNDFEALKLRLNSNERFLKQDPQVIAQKIIEFGILRDESSYWMARFFVTLELPVGWVSIERDKQLLYVDLLSNLALVCHPGEGYIIRIIQEKWKGQQGNKGKKQAQLAVETWNEWIRGKSQHIMVFLNCWGNEYTVDINEILRNIIENKEKGQESVQEEQVGQFGDNDEDGRINQDANSNKNMKIIGEPQENQKRDCEDTPRKLWIQSENTREINHEMLQHTDNQQPFNVFQHCHQENLLDQHLLVIAQEIDIQLPEEVHLLVLVHEFLLFIDSGKAGDIARDKWRFRLNEATGEYYWLCKETHKTSKQFPYKTELQEMINQYQSILDKESQRAKLKKGILRHILEFIVQAEDNEADIFMRLQKEAQQFVFHYVCGYKHGKNIYEFDQLLNHPEIQHRKDLLQREGVEFYQQTNLNKYLSGEKSLEETDLKNQLLFWWPYQLQLKNYLHKIDQCNVISTFDILDSKEFLSGEHDKRKFEEFLNKTMELQTSSDSLDSSDGDGEGQENREQAHSKNLNFKKKKQAGSTSNEVLGEHLQQRKSKMWNIAQKVRLSQAFKLKLFDSKLASSKQITQTKLKQDTKTERVSIKLQQPEKSDPTGSSKYDLSSQQLSSQQSEQQPSSSSSSSSSSQSSLESSLLPNSNSQPKGSVSNNLTKDKHDVQISKNIPQQGKSTSKTKKTSKKSLKQERLHPNIKSLLSKTNIRRVDSIKQDGGSKNLIQNNNSQENLKIRLSEIQGVTTSIFDQMDASPTSKQQRTFQSGSKIKGSPKNIQDSIQNSPQSKKSIFGRNSQLQQQTFYKMVAQHQKNQDKTDIHQEEELLQQSLPQDCSPFSQNITQSIPLQLSPKNASLKQPIVTRIKMADTLRKKSKDSSENVNFSPKSKKSPFSEKKGSPLSRFFNAAESGSKKDIVDLEKATILSSVHINSKEQQEKPKESDQVPASPAEKDLTDGKLQDMLKDINEVTSLLPVKQKKPLKAAAKKDALENNTPEKQALGQIFKKYNGNIRSNRIKEKEEIIEKLKDDEEGGNKGVVAQNNNKINDKLTKDSSKKMLRKKRQQQQQQLCENQMPDESQLFQEESDVSGEFSKSRDYFKSFSSLSGSEDEDQQDALHKNKLNYKSKHTTYMKPTQEQIEQLAEKKANKAIRSRKHEINHWDKEQMFDDDLFINGQAGKNKNSPSRISQNQSGNQKNLKQGETKSIKAVKNKEKKMHLRELFSALYEQYQELKTQREQLLCIEAFEYHLPVRNSESFKKQQFLYQDDNDDFLYQFEKYYREKREIFKRLHPFLDSLLIVQPISSVKNKNISITHSSGGNNPKLDGLALQGGQQSQGRYRIHSMRANNEGLVRVFESISGKADYCLRASSLDKNPQETCLQQQQGVVVLREEAILPLAQQQYLQDKLNKCFAPSFQPIRQYQKGKRSGSSDQQVQHGISPRVVTHLAKNSSSNNTEQNTQQPPQQSTANLQQFKLNVPQAISLEKPIDYASRVEVFKLLCKKFSCDNWEAIQAAAWQQLSLLRNQLLEEQLNRVIFSVLMQLSGDCFSEVQKQTFCNTPELRARFYLRFESLFRQIKRFLYSLSAIQQYFGHFYAFLKRKSKIVGKLIKMQFQQEIKKIFSIGKADSLFKELILSGKENLTEKLVLDGNTEERDCQNGNDSPFIQDPFNLSIRISQTGMLHENSLDYYSRKCKQELLQAESEKKLTFFENKINLAEKRKLRKQKKLEEEEKRKEQQLSEKDTEKDPEGQPPQVIEERQSESEDEDEEEGQEELQQLLKLGVKDLKKQFMIEKLEQSVNGRIYGKKSDKFTEFILQPVALTYLQRILALDEAIIRQRQASRMFRLLEVQLGKVHQVKIQDIDGMQIYLDESFQPGVLKSLSLRLNKLMNYNQSGFRVSNCLSKQSIAASHHNWILYLYGLFFMRFLDKYEVNKKCQFSSERRYPRDTTSSISNSLAAWSEYPCDYDSYFVALMELNQIRYELLQEIVPSKKLQSSIIADNWFQFIRVKDGNSSRNQKKKQKQGNFVVAGERVQRYYSESNLANVYYYNFITNQEVQQLDENIIVLRHKYASSHRIILSDLLFHLQELVHPKNE